MSYVCIRKEEGKTLFYGIFFNNNVLELAPEEVLLAESHPLSASVRKYVSLYRSWWESSQFLCPFFRCLTDISGLIAASERR